MLGKSQTIGDFADYQPSQLSTDFICKHDHPELVGGK